MTTTPKRDWKLTPLDTTGLATSAHDAPALAADAGVESAEQPRSAVGRREFLRLVGFSFAAAGVSGCTRGPAQAALSLGQASEHVVAGRPYWIATTSWADGSGSGVLAKCRDGRPIKLEGNPQHPINAGGLSAACQASLLALYDSKRFDAPQRDGADSSWDDVDAAVRERLAALRASGGRVRLLTSTLTGPSSLAWVERLLAELPDARHVTYDALSCSALLDAQQATRGVRVLPRPDLASARVLACFDADVLGTWISPAEYTKARAAARRPDGDAPGMSRHWQFEARLSVSGSRADRRVRLAPWETNLALAVLAEALARRADVRMPGPTSDVELLDGSTHTALIELADELWAARGEALVLCGRNDRDAQHITAWIQELLGCEGRTLHSAQGSRQRLGDDAALEGLRDELLADSVELLIVAGCNPAYDLPGFADALTHAGTLICTSALPDETSALAGFVCPEPHELERWDDAEPVTGLFCTSQPTLPALKPGRSLRASLASWLGEPRDDRELLLEHWRAELGPRREETGASFEAWFDQVLERGFVQLPSPNEQTPSGFDDTAVGPALEAAARTTTPEAGALSLVLYPKVGLLDGRGAHNPWLQELPDPVSKVVWDNHADLSPATARRLGLSTGDVVRITADDGAGADEADDAATLDLPVLVQPGQHDGVVAVALGYGRAGTDRFTDVGPEWLQGRETVERGGTVGENAAPWLQLQAGALSADGRAVSVRTRNRRHELACTQDHHSLEVPAHLAPKGHEVRDAVRLVSFDALTHDPEHALGDKHVFDAELWQADHEGAEHRWGLAVDLAACTGCSACVVGCQAENNIPVVGRDEVRRHREMSWLRIDRYYAESDAGDVEVVHQPMMCQHCGHAPCETVCPVLATMHSAEGLNQQVYNRCVGTRYCANNCPYKTRRFNWFDYAREDQLQNMVLNPEVTIRSRGIMEKCSLCVQRIQAAKAEASQRGEPLADGDITTACQQSCPAEAIVFGDLNDPESLLSKRLTAARTYTVLEELNLKPVVHYLADVRNA